MKQFTVGLLSLISAAAWAATPTTVSQTVSVSNSIPVASSLPTVNALPAQPVSMPAVPTQPPSPQTLMGSGAAVGQPNSETPETIIVQPGNQNITIALKANPTTGFMWFLQDYNQALLTLTSYQYQAPKTNLVGAGGVALFQFALKPALFDGPQVTSLHFVYSQPWQYGNGQQRTIQIISTGGGNNTAGTTPAVQAPQYQQQLS